jgi:arginase
MGVSHLIGKGDPEVAHLGPRFPLLPAERITLFGYQPYEVEPNEQRLLEASGIARYPVTSMGDRPVERAVEALARLEDRTPAIAVHFDVDVMDSAEIPLANWPHYAALSLGDAMRCLRVFVGTPKLAALVVTEINPDHDPDGLLMAQFVDAFADALRPVAAARR